jgi:hypothetical protein
MLLTKRFFIKLPKKEVKMIYEIKLPEKIEKRIGELPASYFKFFLRDIEIYLNKKEDKKESGIEEIAVKIRKNGNILECATEAPFFKKIQETIEKNEVPERLILQYEDLLIRLQHHGQW